MLKRSEKPAFVGRDFLQLSFEKRTRQRRAVMCCSVLRGLSRMVVVSSASLNLIVTSDLPTDNVRSRQAFRIAFLTQEPHG
jgi:hypothetical protein